MVFSRRIFFANQVTPYIIFFIERDGSTYLTSLMSSHPEINATYERFAVLKQKGVSAEEQLKWADSFLTSPMFGKYSAVGFKTKLVDVPDLEKFKRLLQEKECSVIQMQRLNSVKAVVSKINARRLWEASGKWNLYDENDRQPPTAIAPSDFQKHLEEREEANYLLEKYVGSLSVPTIKLVYEELLQDRESVMDRLFSFLKVKPASVEAKTLKHTKDDLREVLANFNELRTFYAGTTYEKMFDEVLAPTRQLN
jgi:LPS sulfotransferase NodH